MYKKLKLVESTSDRYQVREYDGPGAKFGVYDIKTKKFVQKGSKKVMTAACEDLNKKKSLKEESTEEYWDATEIARDGFMSLMKFNFGTDFKGNNYIITVDANDVVRFRANNDDEAIEKYNKFKENWDNSDHADLTMDIKSIAPRNESANLTEADDNIEDIQDDVKEDLENQKELEDTVNSEEDQEENPVEEESELDTQLNELRDILVDLDLNLYQITDKEDLNNGIYIIGKVAEDSDEVLMLVDTKPEEVNSEEIPEEEPIIDKIDVDNDLEDNNINEIDNNTYKDEDEAAYYRNKELYSTSNLARHKEAMEKAARACKEKGIKLEEAEEIDLENNEESKEDEHKTKLEQRFDFVKLPNTFEEINKLNPRYGEELTPDHESIVEYLMNCLVEINPEAAEELQNNEENEETPIEPEEDIDLDIDINGEEDLENED